MKQSKAKPTRSVARLARQRRALGIELQAIADEASKTSTRGSVSICTVSNVLAGRTKSANVVAVVQRLIEARRVVA